MSTFTLLQRYLSACLFNLLYWLVQLSRPIGQPLCQFSYGARIFRKENVEQWSGTVGSVEAVGLTCFRNIIRWTHGRKGNLSLDDKGFLFIRRGATTQLNRTLRWLLPKITLIQVANYIGSNVFLQDSCFIRTNHYYLHIPLNNLRFLQSSGTILLLLLNNEDSICWCILLHLIASIFKRYRRWLLILWVCSR